MKNASNQELSSEIGCYLILGLEEILGRASLEAVLRAAGVKIALGHEGVRARISFADLSATQQTLEHQFGPGGGSGLAARAGRSGFKYLLRQHGDRVGLARLDYRLMPARARLRKGLDLLAGLMSEIGHEVVSIREDKETWIWSSATCPWCWQRVSDVPICHFTVGLLQEFTSWASNGKWFAIFEEECRAMGKPACRVSISQKSMD